VEELGIVAREVLEGAVEMPVEEMDRGLMRRPG
jgi:hypothetical protein